MSPASYLLKSPAQFFKWFTYAPTYRIVPLCLWVVIVRGWWYWYAATSLWELCSERSWRRYHWIVQYLVPAHLVIAIIYPCLHLHVRCSAQYGIETMNDRIGLVSSISWGLDDGMSWLVRTMGPSFCYDRLSVVEYRRYPAAPIWCIQQRLGWTDGVESQAMMNMIGFVVRFRHIMFIASICLLKFWADTGVCSVLVCVQLHGLCTRGYLIIFSTIEYLHEWISHRQHPRLE